jgi:uncharacterized protein DUF1064
MGARWTEADILAHNARMRKESTPAAAEPKPSKYRNVKVVVDNEKFDSKKEAQLWAELKLRERIGDISDLRRQVPYDLRCPVDWNPTGQAVVAIYIADFVFVDKQGLTHVQDCKGGKATQTQAFNLKRKWLALQSNIEIEIV